MGGSGATAGGGAGGNSTDGPMGEVQLKMSWWGSADRDMRTQKVIDMFMARNPNIKIVTEHYAPTQGMVGTAYWPTLLKHAADNTLPDIMQHDYAYIEDWTAKGWLRALDDLVNDGSLNLADVPPALVDGGKVGGKLMGVSLGLNTQAVVLDTELFTKHNINLPTDEWTWDDFERISKEIRNKAGIWGFGAGLHGYTPGWKAVYLSKGQWVFSADGKSLGYTDDGPWIEHWKMILRLKNLGALPQQHEEPTATNVDQAPIVFKKAGMEHVFSNQLVALWNAANAANGGVERQFKMLPLPKVAGGVSPVYMKPSQYFSVTAASKHPREAAKLIEFFTNDIEANKILGGERGVPINTKVLAAIKPTVSKFAADSFDLVERAGKYATKLPPNDPPGWTTILTEILNAKIVPGIMYEAWTPEMGVALFRKEATDVLQGRPVPDGGRPDVPSFTEVGVEAGADAGDAGAPDAGVDAGADTAPTGGQALLVVGAIPLEPSDQPLQARLAAANLAVETVLAANSTTAMATGKVLVMVSASVATADVTTKFRDVAVPVVLMEPNLFDDMGLTAAPDSDHGTVAAQTQLSIVAAGNALAAGLSGQVTVYPAATRLVFGIPGANAIKVANVVGSATQSTIFAYAQGAMMVGRTAAAKRMSFFIHDSTPALASEPGLKLLDAAIAWAIMP